MPCSAISKLLRLVSGSSNVLNTIRNVCTAPPQHTPTLTPLHLFDCFAYSLWLSVRAHRLWKGLFAMNVDLFSSDKSFFFCYFICNTNSVCMMDLGKRELVLVYKPMTCLTVTDCTFQNMLCSLVKTLWPFDTCRLCKQGTKIKMTALQKEKAGEVWGSDKNNEWIEWNFSGSLSMYHIVTEGKWICGLISVIILQVCVREDSIFIWQNRKSVLFCMLVWLICCQWLYLLKKFCIFIHIWKWVQTTFLHVLNCVLCGCIVSIYTVIMYSILEGTASVIIQNI